MSYINRAVEVTNTIDDDEIRLRRLTKMGQKKSIDGSAQHEKIKSLFEKIIEEGAHPNQITSLAKIFTVLLRIVERLTDFATLL